MRVMRILVALGLTTVASSAAPAKIDAGSSARPAPATQPDVAGERSLALLNGSDLQQELERIAKAIQQHASTGEPMKGRAAADDVIHLYHQKAVTYLLQRDFVRAKKAMDLVLESGRWNESVVMNAARIYGSSEPLRAATLLAKWMSLHGVKESSFDMLGALLAWRDEKADVQEGSAIARQFYSFQSKLEAERVAKQPGLGGHRWGSRWIDSQEFEQIERQREDLGRQIAREQPRLNESKRRLKKLTSKVSSQFEMVDGRGNGNDQENALLSVQGVQEEIQASREKIESLQRQMPKPKWRPEAEPDVPVGTFELFKASQLTPAPGPRGGSRGNGPR